MEWDFNSAHLNDIQPRTLRRISSQISSQRSESNSTFKSGFTSCCDQNTKQKKNQQTLKGDVKPEQNCTHTLAKHFTRKKLHAAVSLNNARPLFPSHTSFSGLSEAESHAPCDSSSLDLCLPRLLAAPVFFPLLFLFKQSQRAVRGHVHFQSQITLVENPLHLLPHHI